MREIVLVQMNDLHGYLESHTEWFWTSSGFVYRKAGGIARIKTIVDNIRAEHGQVLFTDNGDTFHGTRAVVETEGTCLLPILNCLGVSAMTGHWDFAYGPGHLKKLVDQLEYPFLAANIYDKEDGTLVFPPCRRVHIGSIRIGIIGLACNIVDKTMPAHFSEGIRFTDGTEELPRYIAQLREREHVDVVVLLSHLGLPQVSIFWRDSRSRCMPELPHAQSPRSTSTDRAYRVDSIRLPRIVSRKASTQTRCGWNLRS